jgi:hypothetical protein
VIAAFDVCYGSDVHCSSSLKLAWEIAAIANPVVGHAVRLLQALSLGIPSETAHIQIKQSIGESPPQP